MPVSRHAFLWTFTKCVQVPVEEVGEEILQLIGRGESETLEFKSSARWDMREGQKSSLAEKIVLKTVAGFLNSHKGGTLIIGVADDGSVVGLEHDLKTLRDKPNLDGYELFLNNLLLGMYGKDVSAFVRIGLHRVEGKDVCEVQVQPCARPIMVKDEKGQEQLFIRAGNQTIPLSMIEAINYSRMRWK